MTDKLSAPLRRIFIVWAAWLILAWLIPGGAMNALSVLPALLIRTLSPPWPALGGALAAALVAAASAGLVALAAWGAGVSALGLAGRRKRDRLLALATGLPLLAGVAQGLGLLGLADRISLAAATGLCAIPALKSVRVRQLLPSLGAAPPALSAIIMGSGAAVLLAALAPAVSWDEVVYHLRVPSLYLLHQKVYPVPEIFPSFFPFTGEMFAMLARNIGGDPAAHLLHAFMWLACGAAAGRLATALWGRETAPWAAALLLTIPLGQVVAGRAYAEFFLVLPLLCSLTVLEESDRKGEPGAALLAGWLAGTGAGVKYLGGIIALALLGRLLATRHRRFWVPFALAGIAAGGFWFLRNLLWTGNPVVPLILGGPHWTACDMAGWRGDANAFSFDPARLLTAPFALVADPGPDGGLPPLLPIGLAALFIWNRRDPAVTSASTAGRRLLLMALVLLLAWWVSSPLPRYLLPALACLCVGVSGLAGHLQGSAPKTVRLRGLALIGLALSLACGVRAIELGTRPYGAAVGKMSPQDYRREFLRPEGFVETLGTLEDLAPAGGRVYFMGHVSSYDLKRRAWVEFLYTRPALFYWLAGCENAARVRIRARQVGLTHLVYHPLGGKAIYGPYPERMDWNESKLSVWRKFWRAHVREIRRVREWVIYEIAREPGTFPAPRVLPGTEGL